MLGSEQRTNREHSAANKRKNTSLAGRSTRGGGKELISITSQAGRGVTTAAARQHTRTTPLLALLASYT